MAAKLADELLQLILSPSLTISQEKFRSPSITAFGRNDSVSSSSVLLVCKRWLRVATPLLYDAVVIRSTGQSQALADVLHTNPAFARHVKKIRIEGAYASLGQVLVSCTNMKTLVMLLRIYSDVNVTSLCRVLPSISPTDVCIHDEWQIDNMKVRKVFVALCSAIPKWKELTRFDFPYHRRGGGGTIYVEPNITRRARLVDALKESTSIRLIFCKLPQFDLQPPLASLALIPSVTLRIVYNSKLPSQVSSYASMLARISEDSQLSQSSIEFVDVAENSSQPQNSTKQKEVVFDLSSTSLSASPIPKHIWTIIFSFATLPGYPNANSIYRKSCPRRHMFQFNFTRKSLSLVCKTFEELVRPMFFIYPVITTASSFHLFVKKVLQAPGLGSQVRVLSLMGICDMPQTEDDICDLIPHLTRLRHFVGSDPSFSSLPCISAKAFMLLAKAAGSTLATITWLNVSPSGALISPAVLGSFKMLTILDIPSHPPRLTNNTIMHAHSLHTLRELRLGGSSKFVDRVSVLKLPRLRSVTLTGLSASSIENILQACGASVEELKIEGFANFKLVFQLTPKLLKLRWVPPPETGRAKQASTVALALSPPVTHEKLLKFTLSGVPAYGGGEGEQISTISNFFRCIDFAKLPCLKEVKLTSYRWPVEERTISKDLLPHRAVLLKQRHGVDIKDQSGKPWRQRC